MSYKKLQIWKKSFGLTLRIYDETRSYPSAEAFGLVSQMRRASSSIIANLAEGYNKNHLGEYIHSVSIEIGSCNELEVYLLLSNELGYLKQESFDELISVHKEIGKMLFRLRKPLERSRSDGKSRFPS